MKRNEKIGNVKLNMQYYKGQDLYSDGEVEDALLDTVKKYEESEYNRIIAEKGDWAFLYHLSHIRQNIIHPIKIENTQTVLEIGSGCGAITGALADKAKKVTCIELSHKRSEINANRNKHHDNIEIMVGNFQDIEPELGQYDVITLIGVFEYADAYIEAQEPYRTFLDIIKKHLAPNGRIVIAIENKMGLKYFAGCREDHFGTFFEGIENYSNSHGVRTFTRRELEEMFNELGLISYKFMYPYPDYKLPMQIFSDDRLPEIGELWTNIRNFDRDRMLLFDEGKAFDMIIQENMFQVFSNSYLIEVGKDVRPSEDSELIYEKCSNDRNISLAIYTDIIKDNAGNLSVRKYAVNEHGEKHIEGMMRNHSLLSKQFTGSKLNVCDCTMDHKALVFEYLNGVTMEKVLDSYIDQGKDELFKELINEYVNIMLEKNGINSFQVTDSFKRIFGDVKFKGNMHTADINNVDMLFNNIIVRNDKWYMIDYEWCYDFPIPVEFILYRTFNYYLAGNNKRSSYISLSSLPIEQEDIEVFELMEKHFQDYIVSDIVPLWQLYATMGQPAIDIQHVYGSALQQPVLYKDDGSGYSEENCRHVQINNDENGYKYCTWNVEKEIKKYRFDPCVEGALYEVIYVYDENGSPISYDTNGIYIENNIYLAPEDPWIELPIRDRNIKSITVGFLTYSFSHAIGEALKKKYKKDYMLKQYKAAIKNKIRSCSYN